MTAIAGSEVPIQQQSVQFNNPVSEASLSSIGAVCNFLLSIQAPVGSIIPSMLEEPQFLDQIGNPSPQVWVLADGRAVVGSTYNLLTGQTNIPDLRGMFLRGLNNGDSAQGTRSDGNQNPYDPSGTFTPGQYSADVVVDHTHQYTKMSAPGFGHASTDPNSYSQYNTSAQTGSYGGLETAPKNVSINWYIRIN